MRKKSLESRKTNKLTYGVGLNDADYVVNSMVAGKQYMCPLYMSWRDMMCRCYSEKYQKRYPAYKGCEVCEEWKTFMAFRSWMAEQDWQGKQLDKDFLGNGKLYAPDTCVFIPSWLNTLFMDCRKSRGNYPQGVSKRRKGYLMSVHINGSRVTKNYNTVEEAATAYVQAKTAHVRSLYPLIESIDPRLVPACERKLKQLQAQTGDTL